MYGFAKRVFDFVLAVCLLPIAGVICFGFGTAFYLLTREPPVFRQQRTGLGNKSFLVFKLRTMVEANDPDGTKLPDEDRVTPLGSFMRRFSIDEIPQIWNIILGQMSFVGPRPQVDEFLRSMSEVERKRHDVLPGITGWAQINGRNATSWTHRFGQDLWYVKNASFLLDLWILARTPLVVLRGNGVSHPDHATMPTLFDERSSSLEEAVPLVENEMNTAKVSICAPKTQTRQRRSRDPARRRGAA